MTGPNVVKTVTGEEVTYEELGGVEAHGTQSGVSHQVCETEEQAFEEVRYLLSFFLNHQIRSLQILSLKMIRQEM